MLSLKYIRPNGLLFILPFRSNVVDNNRLRKNWFELKNMNSHLFCCRHSVDPLSSRLYRMSCTELWIPLCIQLVPYFSHIFVHSLPFLPHFPLSTIFRLPRLLFVIFLFSKYHIHTSEHNTLNDWMNERETIFALLLLLSIMFVIYVHAFEFRGSKSIFISFSFFSFSSFRFGFHWPYVHFHVHISTSEL